MPGLTPPGTPFLKCKTVSPEAERHLAAASAAATAAAAVLAPTVALLETVKVALEVALTPAAVPSFADENADEQADETADETVDENAVRSSAPAAPAAPSAPAAPAAADSGGPCCEEFIYDFWESYRLSVEATAAADAAFIASRAAEWPHAGANGAGGSAAGAEEASSDAAAAVAAAAMAWRDAQLKEVAERKARYCFSWYTLVG